MTGPQITILFREGQEREEIALLLEVIAGEIRHGHESGDETHATWVMVPPVRDMLREGFADGND